MTVGELKKILEKIEDEIVVMIPLDEDMFITPCIEESGVEELLLDDEDNEPEPTFVLVPCGFYCEMEDEIDPQLN